MVWLDAGIDHQRAMTTPVLVLGETIHSVYIVRGIGARKSRPQKIIQFCGGKFCVIYQNQQGISVGEARLC